MTLTVLKLLFAAIIFATGLGAGLLQFKLNSRQRLLALGEAFASGVFLSAALLHMLPDATQGFHLALGANSYPWAQLSCALVFIVLLFMERGVLALSRQHMASDQQHAQRCAIPYLLAAVLAIHSLIVGAALGISLNLASASIIFLAIIAHKGSAGFALATSLNRYGVPIKRITQVILIFALATPLGIIIASFTEFLLHTNGGYLTEAIFNACAAGTFLYLGTVHTIMEEEALQTKSEALFLLLGVLIMALVAIWL